MKNNSTTDRYLNFLSSLSERQRGFSSLGKVIAKSRVSSILGSVLKKKSLVQNTGGVWKWNGPKPDSHMATSLVNEVNQTIKDYVNKKNGRSTTKSSAAKPAKRTYTKRAAPMNAGGTKMSSSTDTLSVSSLKDTKEALAARMTRLDKLISAVEEFNNGN